MEKTVFDEQIARLKRSYDTQYKKFYDLPERIALFWRAFSRVHNDTFVEAVDECIASYGTAPMMKQLNAAVDRARAREIERRAEERLALPAPKDPLAAAAEAAPTEARRDFARACVQMIGMKYTMPPAQWEEGCRMLEETARAMGNYTCRTCNGDGYAFKYDEKGYRFLGRCSCSTGRSRPSEIFSKDFKGNEVRIPIPIVV